MLRNTISRKKCVKKKITGEYSSCHRHFVHDVYDGIVYNTSETMTRDICVLHSKYLYMKNIEFEYMHRRVTVL